MKLHVAKDLPFPAEYVTQRTGILGQTGSGKTTTASSVCEELLKHKLPTCIVDPTGAWWGLKSSKDGKSEGYPITVIGGDHGDLPLEESAGKMLAELVATEAPPLILDLSGFSLAGGRRFMTDFAERLYEKNRNALHLVLDEADEFAPQRIPKGGERLYGAIDKIVRKGRIRGLGVTMICQRSAAIAKDILSQCSTLIAHRTSHPRDLDPVLEWMKVHATQEQLKEVHGSIAKLEDGEAWLMSPQFLKHFGRVMMRDRETFNSSATPKAGERPVLPKVLAQADLAVLRERMKDTIEKAAAENPRALQKRISELEGQLAKASANASNASPTEKRVEVPVLRDSQVAALVKLAERLDEMFNRIADVQLKLHDLAGGILDAIGNVRNARPPPHSTPAQRPASIARPAVPQRPAQQTGAEVGNSGLRRMLIALAQRPNGLTIRQLGVRAGISSKSGTFSTYLSRARAQRWVDGRGDVKITEAGIVALGSYDPLPEGRGLADYWLNELGDSGAARILRSLLEAYPSSLDAQTIGQRASISHASGTFSTYISKLRSLELIEGRGEMRASGELF